MVVELTVQPEITVIIPNWNKKDLLHRCLTSLSRQSAPSRILVIDNGSSDGSPQMVRDEFPDFDCIDLDRNYGFAEAVNRGIQNCHTPYLALLNNDTEVASEWIQAALTAFREFPECGFLASRMINFFERDRLDSAGDCYGRSGLPTKRGLGLPKDEYAQGELVLGASAGAAFYRRELFERIGLFDTSYYMYLEDVDISLRAQLAGFKCRYIPEATVYHIEAASDPARRVTPEAGRSAYEPFYSNDRVYWITRNRWQLMVTYQPLRNLPFLVVGWGRSFLFHAIKAGFLVSFLKGLLAGMMASPQALRKRKEIRKTRVLSTSELCRLIRMC